MAKQIWVKKPVSKQEYKNWHSKQETYTPLRDEGDRIWVGFLVADSVPENCLEVTGYEELMSIDKWRDHHHIRPKPLEDKFVEKKAVNQEALNKFKEWKKNLFKVPENN